MYLKKSMVLSGNGNKRAVLSVEAASDGVSGSVRLYNFKEEPSGILTLGIMDSGKVHKAGMTRKSPFFYTFAADGVKGLEKFVAAVVNTVASKPTPILYGALEGQFNGEEALASCLNEFASKEELKIEEVEEILENADIDISDEVKEEVEKAIDEELAKKPDCSSCKYREVFFEDSSRMEIPPFDKERFDACGCDDCEVKVVSKLEREIKGEQLSFSDENESFEPQKEEIETENFYVGIKGEIDNFFAENGSEEVLTSIIPNSKWAKMEYETTGEFYAVGLIFEDEQVRYIAYAVPGVFGEAPPKELLGFPVFLPLDENKPEGFGYYISYQDALTGEEVKAKII